MGIALVAALAVGCAAFASKSELRLVGQLEASDDPQERAALLDTYDERFGERGRLGGRVDVLRPQVEEDLWAEVDRQGLREPDVAGYLSRYPEGSHADEARRRIEQLRYFAEADRLRQEEQRRAEEVREQQLAAEQEARRGVVREGLERWLRTALSIRWGLSIEALAAADQGFREQWPADQPAECMEGTCRRVLSAGYFFARPGLTRVDRSLSLALEVHTEGDRVRRLVGYYSGRGFVDWLELSSNQVIERDTEADRETARDAMLAMVQGAVDALLPGASEVESSEEGVLAQFRRGDIEVTLREFPPSFAAGRVDGIQVTYLGDLAAAAEQP